MSDIFDQPHGATPLSPDEREGLVQTWITDRADLNEAEQENIVRGAAWARKRLSIETILSEPFVKKLHARMFGDVWRWAGSLRTTDKNLGVPTHEIPLELRNLLDDVRYWVKHETHPPDEIAVRLHHRLVAIHPFPNGNGRHARLLADLAIEALGGRRFSWGGESLAATTELRARYIAALRAADDHDIRPLLAFARS